MGIFSRFKDIINANINVLLEKAEDPEKMIRLMIREMEDTIVDVKAATSSNMAAQARMKREEKRDLADRDKWAKRAEVAIEKGRDDLAKEALIEKRKIEDSLKARVDALERSNVAVEEGKKNLILLEKKLDQVRMKHSEVVKAKKEAEIAKERERRSRIAGGDNDFSEIDRLEARVEHMTQRSDRVMEYGSYTAAESEFSKMERESEVDDELAALKKKIKGGSNGNK